MNLREELWLAIGGYEGSYEVSNLGRIRSLDRWIYPDGQRPYFRTGGVMAPRPCPPGGYLIVGLTRDGLTSTKRVHRMVAEAFVTGRAPGLEVCHINGDQVDNRAENLRWDTHASNMQDRVIHGTHPFANRTHCGRGHEYTPKTLIVRRGRRCCRPCERARDERFRSAKRERSAA